MKIKILVVLQLLCIGVVFGQKKEKDTTDAEFDLYIGVGLSNQKWNINKNLVGANWATINESLPEFTVGFGMNGKKFSGDIELSSAFSIHKEGTNKTRLASSTGRLSFGYNLVNKPKFLLASGLNIAFTGTQLDVFNQNATVDLNNLNPNANSGHVQLINGMLFVGPSISAYLFKNTKYKVRARASYEFAVTNGKWSSEFLNVANTVKEQGNNRLMFGIVMFSN